MATRIDRDGLDSKIALLRLKHRQEDGSVLMSDILEDLMEWLEEQELEIDYRRMAVEASESYYTRHKAYQNIDKNRTASLFEDQALIALSIDKPEHVEMGDAVRRQMMKHSLVVNQEFARQSSAYTRKIEFIGTSVSAYLDDTEKLRQVVQRESSGVEDQREAAD